MLRTWKRETEGKVKFRERFEGIGLLALNMEGVARSQGVQAAPGGGKRQEVGSPPEPPAEEHSPTDFLILAHWGPLWTSDLQNSKTEELLV